MSEINDLDSLPIAEMRRTFWHNEVWLNGEMISRKHLFSVWRQSFETWVNLQIMILRYRIASRLMRGMCNSCPYCNYLIKLEDFTKIDPKVVLEVKRIDDLRLTDETEIAIRAINASGLE